MNFGLQHWWFDTFNLEDRKTIKHMIQSIRFLRMAMQKPCLVSNNRFYNINYS